MNIDFNTESFAFLGSSRFNVLKRLDGAKLALQHLLCLIEHPILRLAFHHSQSYMQFFNPLNLCFR